MVINYLRSRSVSAGESHGGIIQKQDKTWNLTLPTGEQLNNVVFTATEAEAIPDAQHLTLEDARIRGMVMAKTSFAEGQPIPSLTIPGLTVDIQGFWSLWRISIYTDDWNQQRIMPLFLHDNGRVFLPTARHIWEQMLSVEVEIQKHLAGEEAREIFSKVWESGLLQPTFRTLTVTHQKNIEKVVHKTYKQVIAKEN
ncbi:MAG: hypothetical protein KME60_30180 [Cyanomargarita calcarea GSE-NOS-MK-12-04C]|jgi:hypothetical protein|uniref:Uncharacterized protein n=1 Tax=Cyanomargarita calcarea GSE-NOS-MK-12-04C TaxID=2839659 RepID=A0A951UZU2_9CYAN|nr:hypothetical protein [Cyanomargarita calcarea GSE-NOS-MK-12-04C]